ncbi:hypothetical protein GCM10010172_40240 [Paractinoplanes ferrugineus]|uniref:Uncharacterized protein n=1 Tax=Paractinoplanes ferrugineus TaxID=113564 RepID=A0A919JB59_9ACTN|nr:hypothetical protein [Actinoplanes ferrugineus]GIE16059.1 hypothetical protein Afe05nite_78990 [Actinoplanes ferrugineus]
MTVDLRDRHVRAVTPAEQSPHSYFVFADGRLLRVGAGSTRCDPIAEVPSIREIGPGTGEGRESELRLYVHGPWVCVTERFGVNAALVNTATGAVRELSRADYHADVSSYSIGFLDRGGRTLLVAQTRWNRLDVFDAASGACLTERIGEVEDIDYFHSLLHVSPDSRHFLSNGWVWAPVDMVRVFTTEAFLTGYEPTSIPVGTAFGYNWDRPCTFVDARTFVLALDDEAAEHPYRQLAFFDVPGEPDERLEPHTLVSCDVFPRNEHGEVKGELHYDPESRHLVALTDGAGAFLVSPAGEVSARLPDLMVGGHGGQAGWSYAPRHRVFFRWNGGSGIEERRIQDCDRAEP